MQADRSPDLEYRERGDVCWYSAVHPFTVDGILYNRADATGSSDRPMIDAIPDHEGICELEGFGLDACLPDRGAPHIFSRPPTEDELDAWVWDRGLSPEL